MLLGRETAQTKTVPLHPHPVSIDGQTPLFSLRHAKDTQGTSRTSQQPKWRFFFPTSIFLPRNYPLSENSFLGGFRARFIISAEPQLCPLMMPPGGVPQITGHPSCYCCCWSLRSVFLILSCHGNQTWNLPILPGLFMCAFCSQWDCA